AVIVTVAPRLALAGHTFAICGWTRPCCLLQVAPPSLVVMTVPKEPTAQPRATSMKATELRLPGVLALLASWACQLAPPSVVARMIGT
ncbi:MAG TPA: hypothetical protein VIK32_13390, partial [Candidatus Limnocylindrales bacterium]